jgi:hypothetical protein
MLNKYVLQSLKNNLHYGEGRNDLFGLVSEAQHDWKVYWKSVTFHFINVLNPGTFICIEIFQSSCAVYSFCSSFKHLISKLLLVQLYVSEVNSLYNDTEVPVLCNVPYVRLIYLLGKKFLSLDIKL